MTAKASLEAARALIEKATGPFQVAKLVSDGRNCEISAIVSAGGDITFVKGRRADHRRAWTQDRERAVNPAVRPVSPRLKWSARDRAWDLNGFEYVPGRHADYSPGSPDLPKIAAMLRQLQEIPCPDTELKQAAQRWAAYTDRPELLAGTSLLHTEWTPGNVLISDRAHLVDWAWPTRGAAWIDPACWAVWLIQAGHSPHTAESHAAQIPSWHDAPAESLDQFARAQQRMWAGIAAESSEPWTKSIAAAARLWTLHRAQQADNRGRE